MRINHPFAMQLLASRIGWAGVAMQALTRQLGISVSYHAISNRADEEKDAKEMTAARGRVWQQRRVFTLDHHVERLIAALREVIGSGSRRSVRSGRMATAFLSG